MQANTAVKEKSAVHAEANETQYLTFELAGEQFGVDILEVQEIRGWSPVTVIPNAPVYVKGVTNLRGTIVPVIDMRIRLSLPEAEYTDSSVVIVMSLEVDGVQRTAGFVVDSVSDVLNIANTDVRAVPQMSELEHSKYLTGIAARGDELVLILDASLIFSQAELTRLDNLEANS